MRYIDQLINRVENFDGHDPDEQLDYEVWKVLTGDERPTHPITGGDRPLGLVIAMLKAKRTII